MHSIKEAFYGLKQKRDAHLQTPLDRSAAGGPAASDNVNSETSNRNNVTNQQPTDAALLEITQHAIDVFLASAQPDGQIGGIGYWQTANGYTAIALHDFYATSARNTSYLSSALEKVALHHKDLINEFNDDTLWWSNCLLDICETRNRSQKSSYLSTVMKQHHHISKTSIVPRGVHYINGNDMYGAVMWTTRKDEDQVNSITTGLYAEVSARLALLVPSGSSSHRHRDWLSDAERSLDWIMRCRYRAHEALVLDTIKLRTKECVDWTFTYTTGQAIAACVALYNVLGHGNHYYQSMRSGDAYLDLACEMAEQAMQRPGWVEKDSGILTEHGAYGKDNHEAWKNDDAVGFKSVLVRALGKLYRAIGGTGGSVDQQQRQRQHELRCDIKKFIERQFSSLQESDTNGRGQYGPWWAGPMDLPTSHSQLAVLDVMAAIHLTRRT